MVQMTMHVPDDLARRIEPIGSWLPTIIELSLAGFKTVAVAAATEVIQFLLQNPSAKEVIEYHISEKAQTRLQRLLVLNESGILSADERLELDELERLEHIIVLLKAQVSSQA